MSPTLHKALVPLTVMLIDLQATPPAVIATHRAGLGASGVSLNKQGNLVLVANRNEATVSVFTVEGKVLTPAGKVKLGDEKSGPSHVIFTPDGKSALVTRDGDNTLSMLGIEGAKVEACKRDFAAGLRPYGADISPDGRTLAVVIHNGSGKAKESPFYNPQGQLLLCRVEGLKPHRITQAPLGRWSQGIAFSRHGTTILVQNMLEQDIRAFRFDGAALTDTGQRIKLSGGGAALRTAKY